MLNMILKMSGVTVIYVLLTALIWNKTRDKELSFTAKIIIGVFYGLCSILSTHFGIDYGAMLLNVRDLGPLSAGLFFHPVSGIISGLVGGIERYIAGRYWDVGSYTTIACSVSTMFAGFLAAILWYFVFKKKRPVPVNAFFIGSVMEVFHMYAIFLTHHSDMKMAYYVVKTCAPPMIFFSGIGLTLSSCVVQKMAGEWKDLFKSPYKKEQYHVTERFQHWLFGALTVFLVGSLFISYTIQTQRAVQDAHETLEDLSKGLRETYIEFMLTQDEVKNLAENTALSVSRSIATAVEQFGRTYMLSPAVTEKMRSLFNLEAICIFSSEGRVRTLASAPDFPAADYLDQMKAEYKDPLIPLTEELTAACTVFQNGEVCSVINYSEGLAKELKLSSLNKAISSINVGNSGSFDIIDTTGYILAGTHKDMQMEPESFQAIKSYPEQTFFDASFFDQEAICRKQLLKRGTIILTRLPLSEVYENRDAGIYETVFADILLIASVYLLITILVRRIVVDDLEAVNSSLNKITNGNLNEVVSVRNSLEFSMLSDDINQTVGTLKEYIAAAEKRIDEELMFARTIQESALPRNFSFQRKDFDIYALMDPAKEVGGDFYDFFFTSEDKLALVIADVSGKGIPAALFMMRSKTAIRSITASGLSPEEIFKKVNAQLCEGNEADIFVTVWIGIVDLTTGLMKCANAGHEYPIIMHSGEEYELIKDKHSLALAAMPEVKTKSYEILLHPGDSLFVYTDGIPEAINEQVEDYGTERLLQILNRSHNMSMKDTLTSVREDISFFVGGAEQFDDITMLGFHFYGPDAEDPDRTDNN